MAIAAYFDESGTHEGAGVMTLAGYVAAEEQWIKFSEEWLVLLHQFGVSSFHMTDVENLRGEFEGWDRTRKHEFLRRVVRIITTRVRRGFAYSIDIADFDAVIAGKYDDCLGNVYIFCVGGVLREIEVWADKYKVERIAYVFDKGALLAEQLPKLMATAMNEMNLPRFRISGWIFADRKQTIPLQAADILAYESRKHWLNRRVASQKRPERTTMSMLVRNGPPNKIVWVERSAMERMIGILTESGEISRGS